MQVLFSSGETPAVFLVVFLKIQVCGVGGDMERVCLVDLERSCPVTARF